MTRILLATLLVVCAGNAFADECAFPAKRTLDLPAEGLNLLRLKAQAGDLRINGVAGLKQIELRGKACASSAEALEQLQLQHNRDGAALSVVATSPETATFSLFGSNYAYIDLEVRVPDSLPLSVDDSSGDIDIDAIAALDLTDSSGDIRIRDTHGDLRLADSSGDINVGQTQGNVVVRSDSSGEIVIRSVRRDVTIEDDSSGDIDIDEVSGNVRVDNDSSGDIHMRHIGGNAEVGSDSSGEIVADEVKGDFSVRSKSGGARTIEHSAIGGKVRLPSRD